MVTAPLPRFAAIYSERSAKIQTRRCITFDEFQGNLDWAITTPIKKHGSKSWEPRSYPLHAPSAGRITALLWKSTMMNGLSNALSAVLSGQAVRAQLMLGMLGTIKKYTMGHTRSPLKLRGAMNLQRILTVLLLACSLQARADDQRCPHVTPLETPTTQVNVTAPADANTTDWVDRGCCSWHGGQCGCSGGRVTCCDASTSPSCLCQREDPPDRATLTSAKPSLPVAFWFTYQMPAVSNCWN